MRGGLVFGMIKIIFVLIVMFALYYLIFQNLADTAGIFPAWVVGNPMTLLLASIIMMVILFSAILLL